MPLGPFQKGSEHHMKAKVAAAGMEDREQEVAESEKTQLQLADGPSLEEVRKRAYELHVEGGCVHGCDLDDWLQAEQDLTKK
jgi:hypothetical protein